jgi:uncharacterized protein YkwD
MKYFLSALILLAFFACKKNDTTPPTDPNYVYNVHKDQILKYVNAVRVTGCDCGGTAMPAVPVVAWNDTLAKTSFLHSDDMYKNGFFSHVNLAGKNPGDRLTAQGYDWATYAENISVSDFSDSAVVANWLSNAGNCKNIMGASYRFVGAGMSTLYWTMILASHK